MNGGTIFVLGLAAAFLFFAIYLARLSKASRREEENAARHKVELIPGTSKEDPPLKKAG